MADESLKAQIERRIAGLTETYKQQKNEQILAEARARELEATTSGLWGRISELRQLLPLVPTQPDAQRSEGE